MLTRRVGRFGKELTVSLVQDQSYKTSIDALTGEILLPDGYELAYYTLRRAHDGHLQSFLPVNTGAPSVQAVPIDAQLSDIQALEGLQANQEGPESGSLVPICSSNHVPNE